MKNIPHYTDSIHYELEQTAKLLRKLAMQLFDKLNLGISPDEYSALDTISVNAEICQRDLAKLIIKDRANTGRIVNSLEEKGFITRCIDTKNNRLVKKLTISQAGKKELKFVNSKIQSYVEGVVEATSHDEIEEVRLVLKNFRNNLEKTVEINI
jgi:DNA-binding MarR family transcriptional regulator